MGGKMGIRGWQGRKYRRGRAAVPPPWGDVRNLFGGKAR
ncbi:hypothetical protein B4135_1784 [Caldibacillus debilis]|uniref:Uncharacterized protein n=1 Tax=Caldibacillus debilis TaxID=301148 RepID=A0A150M7S6_9BACI|nr:hypothetical protein B4135_1784 [Caldibacillus debilis]